MVPSDSVTYKDLTNNLFKGHDIWLSLKWTENSSFSNKYVAWKERSLTYGKWKEIDGRTKDYLFA